MNFTLNKTDAYNAYEYVSDGKSLAEITWIEQNGTMTMDHTYVSDELRGQGVAKQLLDKAAAYAREHDLKMRPVCSYVVSAFEKSDEYNDVKV